MSLRRMVLGALGHVCSYSSLLSEGVLAYAASLVGRRDQQFRGGLGQLYSDGPFWAMMSS
eukprot:13978577-Alexandrium_andersonii.AAC.1